MKRIVISAGCFGGVEAYFQRLKGIVSTRVGYVNGNKDYPRYEELINQTATHAEACELIYDESVLPFKKILEYMFRIIDPTSINRQGNDIGLQYRAGIYYSNNEDCIVAENFISEISKKYHEKITVAIEREQGFFPAEEYHQDYLKKNPQGYCHVDFNLIKKEEHK